MKWLVFACESYYPRGGWDDYITSAQSFEEALNLAAVLLKSWDWAQVVEPESELQVEVRNHISDEFKGTQPCWGGPLKWDERRVRWMTVEDERTK